MELTNFQQDTLADKRRSELNDQLEQAAQEDANRSAEVAEAAEHRFFELQ